MAARDNQPAPVDALDLERRLAESEDPAAADLSGPIRVLAGEDAADGLRVVEVAATRLVPVEESEPALADVSVGVPVTARLELDADGAIVAVEVAEADPTATREARAYTRNLIANGEVGGLPPSGGRVRRGPPIPKRTTHELTVDDRGRKVIRRSGFSVAPGMAPGAGEGGRPSPGMSRRGGGA